MTLVVTLGFTFGFILVGALLTDRRAGRRRLSPVTSRIERMSRRHQGASGLIVEVLWPVSPRGISTVSGVFGVERRRFWRTKGLFRRGPASRHLPFWVPLGPGRHLLEVSDWGGKHRKQHELVVELDPGEHALVTCWPAKRGFVTRARPETAWRVQSLELL